MGWLPTLLGLAVLGSLVEWPEGLLLHSEKFKMNEEVDSFLSEKVSNLLLT